MPVILYRPQALLHCVAIIKFSGESGLRNCLLGLINGIWWNHFWHHTLTNRLLAEPSWPLTFPSWVISLLFYPVRRDLMVSGCVVCFNDQWFGYKLHILAWSPLLSPPFVLGNKAHECMHTLVRSYVFPPPFTSPSSHLAPSLSSPDEVISDPPTEDYPGVYSLELPGKMSVECTLQFCPNDVCTVPS